jgi:PAS domain S-box-containing protein
MSSTTDIPTSEVERYFALAPEMVILAGFDGYWKRVNPTVEAVLGYTEVEALSRPFMEFVHPDDRERTEDEARSVIEGATARSFVNRILCKDGSYKWIEWTATPVPEEGAMWGVGRDVTERRRSESEQAALQRVATLLAGAEQPQNLFAVVAEEVARVLEVPVVSVVRYETDHMATELATFSTDGPGWPELRRWSLDGTSVRQQVRSRRDVARIDDYSQLEGEVAAAAREAGIRSTIGAPIVVAGRTWGAMVVSSKDEPLPESTAARLAAFTDLLATAIGSGESREALARLAEEQAALRRVATLVARDAPSAELFEAVAVEVGRLFDTDITIVGRYDDDGMATAIGNWSAAPGGVPVGTRSAIGGRNLLTMVAETGKPARMDGYDDGSGHAAEIARRHGWRSSIAAPIVVEDRLWGVMLVARQSPRPFPAGAEERLAAFTDLISTTVANAQAHDELRRFGDEQAALGRVATLVAAGAAPEQVFAAVVEEVSTLLGLERIELVRYDGAATGTVIAASGDHPFPAGSTWSLEDPSVMATVARTRRAARIDDYSALEGDIARTARSAGFQSAIGAPMTVDGCLWGVIIAISADPEPIPERSEARLGQFTDLVATAVANAEARQALERVASEQAALRRVATLVAQAVPPAELFEAVALEVSTLLGAAFAGLARFEGESVLVVGESVAGTFPREARLDDGGPSACAAVLLAGRSVRFDGEDWTQVSGPLGDFSRELGVVSTVASPIVVEGRTWGALSISSTDEALPHDTEERLEKFSELVATAIANAEGRSELAASRRRIVAASDEARRRIERDLHDGAQQRLLSLAFALRHIQSKGPWDLDSSRAELGRVEASLLDAVEDLQQLSRGIHPSILSEGGLRPALRTLARRSVVPVDLDIPSAARFPEPIEVAVYYVTSEALANAVKHARASLIEVSLTTSDGRVELSVRDDGLGGADASHGSGLIGLQDRVEALGGTLTVESPLGVGTSLVVTFPLGVDPTEVPDTAAT